MYIDSISIAKYMKQIGERERREVAVRESSDASTVTREFGLVHPDIFSRARAIFDRSRRTRRVRAAGIL